MKERDVSMSRIELTVISSRYSKLLERFTLFITEEVRAECDYLSVIAGMFAHCFHLSKTKESFECLTPKLIYLPIIKKFF